MPSTVFRYSGNPPFEVMLTSGDRRGFVLRLTRSRNLERHSGIVLEGGAIEKKGGKVRTILKWMGKHSIWRKGSDGGEERMDAAITRRKGQRPPDEGGKEGSPLSVTGPSHSFQSRARFIPSGCFSVTRSSRLRLPMTRREADWRNEQLPRLELGS